MLHRRNFLLVCICLWLSPGLLAQEGQLLLRGVLLNSEKKPVEAALIKLFPGQKYAVSDKNGAFMLAYEEKEEIAVVEISHLAYNPVRIPVSDFTDLSNIRITLEETVHVLKEVGIYQRNLLTEMLHASQPVLQVDREFIEKNSTGTLSGALSALPGVNSMNLGVGIGKPVIRGMSFNRILVNNRGIKQEGQQWGAEHGLEIDPFDVESVEIIKGPASLLYGSDGLGGVINIQADKLPESGGNWLDWISSYQTNNRAFSNSLSWQGRSNNWVFGARVTHQDYGDYTIPADEFTYAGFNLPIYENRLKNTAGRELHYSGMVGYMGNRITSTLRFSAFNQDAGIFTGAIGLPRSYNLRHENKHRNIDFPKQENQHLMLISNNTITLGKNQLELDLGIQRNKRLELSFPGAHGIDPSAVNSDLALGLELFTYTANARYQINPNDDYQVLFGGQFQYMDNQRDGFEFLLPDYNTTQWGFFTYHVWEASKRWTANAGIRYDHGHHDIRRHLQPLYDQSTLQPTGEFEERTPAFSRSFENFSGGAGVTYQLDGGNDIKLNVGNSFRFPSAIELSSNGIHHGNFRHEIGDAGLEIERGYQADLTFQHQSENTFLELAAFYAYYDQYIYLSPTGRFSTLASGGTMWQYRQNDALFNGVELLANYQLSVPLKIALVAEFVQNLNLDTDLPLPLTPAASVSGRIEYNDFRWINSMLNDAYFFVSGEQVFRQGRVDRNERTTPSSFLVNTGMGFNLEAFKQAIQVKINVNNVFNTTYFNHISRYRLINLPEQGRNLVVSLKIPVNFANN